MQHAWIRLRSILPLPVCSTQHLADTEATPRVCIYKGLKHGPTHAFSIPFCLHEWSLQLHFKHNFQSNLTISIRPSVFTGGGGRGGHQGFGSWAGFGGGAGGTLFGVCKGLALWGTFPHGSKRSDPTVLDFFGGGPGGGLGPWVKTVFGGTDPWSFGAALGNDCITWTCFLEVGSISTKGTGLRHAASALDDGPSPSRFGGLHGCMHVVNNTPTNPYHRELRPYMKDMVKMHELHECLSSNRSWKVIRLPHDSCNYIWFMHAMK